MNGWMMEEIELAIVREILFGHIYAQDGLQPFFKPYRIAIEPIETVFLLARESLSSHLDHLLDHRPRTWRAAAVQQHCGRHVFLA